MITDPGYSAQYRAVRKFKDQDGEIIPGMLIPMERVAKWKPQNLRALRDLTWISIHDGEEESEAQAVEEASADESLDLF